MTFRELTALVLLYRACNDTALRARVLELVPKLDHWDTSPIQHAPEGRFPPWKGSNALGHERWSATGCKRCGYEYEYCTCKTGFVGDLDVQRVADCLNEGLSIRRAAAELGITRRRVEWLKQKAIEAGQLKTVSKT